MAGPQNVPMGDMDESMNVPESVVPMETLVEEKNKAKYSKTKEFKEIRQYWEDRIKFFESYLPAGLETRWQVPSDDIAQQWVLANNIIAEVRAFLRQYDDAVEVVSNDPGRLS